MALDQAANPPRAGLFARLGMALGLHRRVGLLVLPAVLFLAIFYVYPLIRLLFVSLDAPDLSLRHYVRFFTEGAYVRVLIQTFRVSASVTIVCLILGYPVAYLLARLEGRLRNALLLLVVVPYLTSFLVRTYAWLVLLNRKGVINSMLMDFGVIERPLPLVFNAFGVHVGMAHVMLPLMVLPLYSVMRGIDFRLVTAAQSLGVGPTRAFLRVFLPLSMPGVRSGCLLVFLLSLGFYITPALLGGLRDVMLATFIEAQISQLVDWGFGGAAAFVLLVVTLAGFFVVGKLTGSTSFGATDLGRPSRPPVGAELDGERIGALRRLRRFLADLPPLRAMGVAIRTAVLRFDDWRWARLDRRERRPAAFGRVLLWGVCVLIFVYLILPTFIVVPISFSSAKFLKFPPPGFSWQWYENFLSNPGWLGPAFLSFQVALLTALVSTLLGTLAAYGLVRGRFRQRTVVMSLVVSPIIVSPIVIGVAIYGPLAQWGIIGTDIGIMAGHSIASIAYVVVIVSATLSGFGRNLERASMSLGAGPLRTFRRVTFPLIAPGVISGAVFAFIHSFDELVITLFIAGIQTQTLPLKMWENMRNEIDPTIAAVASILILLPIVVLLVLAPARRGGRAAGPLPPAD